ncbi:MAG: dockerin type I domain-containing protein [Planctomycetota bacterium]
MKTIPILTAFAVMGLLCPLTPQAGEPDWESMPYTPHSEYQAVDADGFGTFPLTDPVRMRGVIVNRPEDMLNGAPAAPGYLGGLWQIFVQTADDDDFGGTAGWMGQYIGKIVGNHPDGSYTDEEWLAEIARLSFDPVSGHEFQPGDLVELRARAPGLAFRGKTNINEQHSNDPAADFDIYLLEADRGLPTPAVLSLADLKDADDEFIFDPDRLTGCEHHQGTLVRFNDIEFVDTAEWGPDAELVIQDGTGRTFPVKIGLGDGFGTYEPPPAPFDIIGILDQEDYNSDDGNKDGYRLWVMYYTGNGYIIPEPFALAGDMNCDGLVNAYDIDGFILAIGNPDDYEQTYPNCLLANADMNKDGIANAYDIDGFIAAVGGG